MDRRDGYVDTVADLDDEPLRCHSWGQPWELRPVEDTVPAELGIACWMQKLRCSSCGKVRTDYLEPGTCVLLWRTYSKVDNFAVLEPTDLAGYRAESIR